MLCSLSKPICLIRFSCQPRLSISVRSGPKRGSVPRMLLPRSQVVIFELETGSVFCVLLTDLKLAVPELEMRENITLVLKKL